MPWKFRITGTRVVQQEFEVVAPSMESAQELFKEGYATAVGEEQAESWRIRRVAQPIHFEVGPVQVCRRDGSAINAGDKVPDGHFTATFLGALRGQDDKVWARINSISGDRLVTLDHVKLKLKEGDNE